MENANWKPSFFGSWPTVHTQDTISHRHDSFPCPVIPFCSYNGAFFFVVWRTVSFFPLEWLAHWNMGQARRPYKNYISTAQRKFSGMCTWGTKNSKHSFANRGMNHNFCGKNQKLVVGYVPKLCKWSIASEDPKLMKNNSRISDHLVESSITSNSSVWMCLLFYKIIVFSFCCPRRIMLLQ